MSHRFVWSAVAALSLAGVIAWLSQTSAQRPGGVPGGMPGMPGNPQHMPGRFVVAHASANQVLVLDTATGQVYRAKEEDFKKMSDMPRMWQPGGGRDVRPPAPDPRPEPKLDKDGRPRDRRPPERDAPKNDEDARRPDRRPPVKDDVRSAPKDQAPSRREEIRREEK